MPPRLRFVPSFVLDRQAHPGKSHLDTLIEGEPTPENRERRRKAEGQAQAEELAWRRITESGSALKPGHLYAFAALWIEVWGLERQEFIQRFSANPNAFKTGYWRARKNRECPKPPGQCDGTEGNCVHAYGRQIWLEQVLEDAARQFVEAEND
jgi:hypothetical protein